MKPHAQKRKPVVRMCLVLLLMFSMQACGATPAQQYESFLADLDIVTRFDLCIDKVKDADATTYTLNELQALKEDISTWDVEYEEAETANEYLVSCADKLGECISRRKEGRDMKARELLAEAQADYSEAKALIRKNNVDSNEGT